MSDKQQTLFTKMNYALIIAGSLLVFIGFILMTGSGNELDATGYSNEFNEDIFSFRRMTLSPIVIILGFITVAVGIMKKFK